VGDTPAGSALQPSPKRSVIENSIARTTCNFQLSEYCISSDHSEIRTRSGGLALLPLRKTWFEDFVGRSHPERNGDCGVGLVNETGACQLRRLGDLGLFLASLRLGLVVCAYGQNIQAARE